jgi:hypothetical protein
MSLPKDSSAYVLKFGASCTTTMGLHLPKTALT